MTSISGRFYLVYVLNLVRLVTGFVFYRFGGLVVRASATEAVDLGSIPGRVSPKTLNLVFTASLLDVQHYRDSVKNIKYVCTLYYICVYFH